MPRRPIRPKLRRQCGLTRDQIQDLIRGSCLIKPTTPDPVFASDEDRKRAWFKNRKFLMTFMGQERTLGNPGFAYGSRPHAWWEFEATGPRRRKRGKPRVAPIGNDLHFGMPENTAEYDEPENYETELQYLKRHGLLTAVEKKALAIPEPKK